LNLVNSAQACWLKLCLIGYKLEEALYDRLRALLPTVIFEQLPPAASRKQSLLPHRGEILEFNRQVSTICKYMLINIPPFF
jgi:hypothetical protein